MALAVCRGRRRCKRKWWLVVGGWGETTAVTSVTEDPYRHHSHPPLPL